MKTESHNLQILEYLQRGLSIAQMEALRQFNCMRLSARINDLRHGENSMHLSFPIVTRMIKLPSGKRIARYRLITIGSIVYYNGNLYRVFRITTAQPFHVDLKNDSGEEHFSVGIEFLS